MPEFTPSIHWIAYLFGALALLGGLVAVVVRNVLHAIFCLAVALLGIAGLFLCLHSPLLAAMQVLIYIGGISVAMVFAVMFAYALGNEANTAPRRFLPLVPAGLFFAVVGTTLSHSTFVSPVYRAEGDIKAIGRALLTHYNVAFEALSVVLLIAIIGAVLVGRKEPGR